MEELPKAIVMAAAVIGGCWMTSIGHAGAASACAALIVVCFFC